MNKFWSIVEGLFGLVWIVISVLLGNIFMVIVGTVFGLVMLWSAYDIWNGREGIREVFGWWI